MEQPIIIKIGTNVLSNDSGKVELDILEMLVDQVAKLHKQGEKIALVTSGAIGVGMSVLDLAKKPTSIIQRQACAALGQHILMMHYHRFFERHAIKVAQILLAYDAFTNQKKSQNLLNAIHELFRHGCIPIINENDVTSIDEIGQNFGDNDMLSAMVSVKLNAKELLILTNVDGLFERNPKLHANAQLIAKVHLAQEKDRWMLEGSSALGVGGMDAKVKAAKYAIEKGCLVRIANGRREGALAGALEGKAGTVFYPK